MDAPLVGRETELLAVRLDRLEAGERAVLERAAIVGDEFSLEAVAELCPEELRGDVSHHLLALAAKELVRADAADGYRFQHEQIRRVVYDATPKESRALFHEWFADRLERSAELDELVGDHLERAVRLRLDIGAADARTRRLAARAVEHLAASGRRALARDDVPTAVNLLDRAHGLAMDETPARAELEIDLAGAYMRGGDFSADTQALLTAAAGRAERLGNRRLALRAAIEHEFFPAPGNAGASSERMTRVAEAAIPELEELGDELGLSRAWWLLSEPHLEACRWGARAGALERALEHARRAGAAREVATIAGLLATSLQHGPSPVAESLARCDGLLADAAGSRAAQAGVLAALGALLAMDGDIAAARSVAADARSRYEELGMTVQVVACALTAGAIELRGGDPDAAERELRAAYEMLGALDEPGRRARIAAALADSLLARGRTDDADALARLAETTASPAEVMTHVLWRCVRARTLVGRGDPAAAVLAGEAWVAAKATDGPELQAAALRAQADVFAASSRPDDATHALNRARAVLERKGDRTAQWLLEPALAASLNAS
jgi:hypothetical protein